MRLVTGEAMRALDQAAIERHGIAGRRLMQRAGLGVAQLVRCLAKATRVTDLPIIMVAGGGNNGGDVFAAASYLLSWGFTVEVHCTTMLERITGDARHFLDTLPDRIVKSAHMENIWDASSGGIDPEEFPRGTIFVDGILGTGARGAPRGTAAAAIRWLGQARRAGGRIVAVDMPSGFDADTGHRHQPHVIADATICLALPKTGLWSPTALEVCGRVEIVDIGFPDELTGESESGGRGWIAEAEVRALAAPRPRAAHKGDFGHALLIGGARGYPGAMALATRACLRSGAGLVSAWVPACVASAVAAAASEAMVLDIGSVSDNCLDCSGLPPDWHKGCANFTAVLTGPGMSRTPQTTALTEALLQSQAKRIILDADALNVFEGRAEALRETEAELVLTPHPGEAARLLGCEAREVQSDREAALLKLVERTGATVVLKGAGTLVGAPRHGIHRIQAGNPGMATGGSGDVLAGLLTGLWAQGMAAFDAARLAVWRHATAGDLAAWRGSETTLLAGDIIDAL